MRRVNRGLLSGLLAGALLLSPVSMVTVSAHGHHGGNGGHHGGQSNSNVTYYCGGHGAHCHENGVCPYAGETDVNVGTDVNAGTDVPYYYCGGHEGHHHENGVCPYAGETDANVGTDENAGTDVPYYYCGGHEGHHHENGVCPYAGEVDMSLAPMEVKVPDKGIEEPGYLSAIGSGELRKRDRSNLLVRSKNVCLGRIGYLR